MGKIHRIFLQYRGSWVGWNYCPMKSFGCTAFHTYLTCSFPRSINKCNDIIIGAEMRLQHALSITFGVTMYNVRVLLLSLTVELSVWSCRVLLARLALDGSASVLVVGIINAILYYLFTCYQHNWPLLGLSRFFGRFLLQKVNTPFNSK